MGADRRRVLLAGAALALLALTGCTSAPSSPPSRAAPTTAPPVTQTQTPTPTPQPPTADGHWQPDGTVTTLASGLDAPWSVVPLDSGALISQRDDGRIRELTADGALRDVGTVRGVASGGEGGLLGIALREDGATTWLYASFTSSADNRVVRMPLTGAAGSYRLGPAETVIDGIRRAQTHNGGRIAFGPDGMLYVTTGDAGDRDASQNERSRNGKILRLTPEGDAAPGNPFGNRVWSYGHRNVQGIAWTSDGTMWASEFGQNTWDELNRIVPGGNYGWPVVEGEAGDERFVDPVAQWRTSDASPSGLAAVGDTLFLAGLRGERLWVVDTADGVLTGDPRAALDDQGRLRDAVAAPDGSLWVLTNNTDGRGSPRADDDLLLRLGLRRAAP